MELPEQIRKQFREFGARGGRRRAELLAPAERRRIARRAAVTRWIRARFGVSRLARLGLPGAETVDRGLIDLASGTTSVESLLVSMAAPRLRRAGVPVGTVEPDAERRLHAMMVGSEGESAHARYAARLRQIASFADACSLHRKSGG